MKKLFLALPLLALAACGGSPTPTPTSDKDVLMSSDIDGMVGWLSDPNAVTKGEAHSGQYALRVNQAHEFSPGYTAILGQLSATRIKGVKLSAWVYATDENAKGKLEFIVRDVGGNKELIHEQVLITDAKEYGKWVPVSREITLPATVNYLSQLVIYVSRAEATTPAYVDDLKLTAIR